MVNLMRNQSLSSSVSRNLITKVFAMGVQFLATLFITRIVVGKYGSEGNGYYSLATDFVSYAQILSIALNSMASRYITLSFVRKEKEETNKYFNTTFFANIVLGISLIIPAVIIVLNLQHLIVIPYEMVHDVKILFLLMFANFILTIITSVFGVATFSNNRIDLDSYRIIESNLLKIAIIYVSIQILELPLWYMGVAVLCSTIYIFIVNLYYTKKLLPDVSLSNRSYYDKSHVKNLISSGIWNSFTQVGSILLGGLDLLIANIFIGERAMGILSISKTIPKYILTAIGNISGVFNPTIMIAYAKNDKDKLLTVIDNSIKLLAIVSIPLQVIVITLGDRIFRVWVPGQNYDLLQILSIISTLGYIIILPFNSLWTVFTATNRVKYSSIYLTIEAACVTGTVFLLLHFVDGEINRMFIIAGVSSVFELIRGIIFLPLFSAYCLKIRKTTFYKVLIRVVFCYFACLFISRRFVIITNFDYNLIQFFIYAVLEVFLSFAICFLCLFSRTQRKNIIKIAKEKIKERIN